MKGIIVLTALPPTKGHAYLIEFARRFLAERDPSAYLHVIVCSKPNDPISGHDRVTAIADAFCNQSRVWMHHRDANDPDLPEEHPDFWDVWKNIVVSKINRIDPDDILFASEIYGIEFAKQLGCQFIPCDPNRDIFDIKASDIRERPMDQFHNILPEYASKLRRRVTFFGAESTGKTSLSRYTGMRFESVWCHEWARPYLETVGEVLDDDKMLNIVRGQIAMQMAAEDRWLSPFVIRDTDLLSTLGYYRISGREIPKELHYLVLQQRSDLYIVMNSKIPFTPDRLRYGGNKRESTDQFWIDLLEEFGFEYRIIREVERYAQQIEVSDILKRYWINDAGFGGYTR